MSSFHRLTIGKTDCLLLLLESLRSLRKVIKVFRSILSRLHWFHLTAVCWQWKHFRRRPNNCLFYSLTAWICIQLCSWRWEKTKNFLAASHRQEKAPCIFTSSRSHPKSRLKPLRLHCERHMLFGSHASRSTNRNVTSASLHLCISFSFRQQIWIHTHLAPSTFQIVPHSFAAPYKNGLIATRLHETQQPQTE